MEAKSELCIENISYCGLSWPKLLGLTYVKQTVCIGILYLLQKDQAETTNWVNLCICYWAKRGQLRQVQILKYYGQSTGYIFVLYKVSKMVFCKVEHSFFKVWLNRIYYKCS